MVDIVTEMEKSMVSPVFFQRLAIKRKQYEDRSLESNVRGSFRGAAARVRASGAGILSRLGMGRRQKSADGDLAGRRRTTTSGRGSVSDVEEREPRRSGMGASFAQGQRSAPGSVGHGAFRPGPARNLRFVRQVGNWGAQLVVFASKTVMNVCSGQIY
jgi:hypothetical protein